MTPASFSQAQPDSIVLAGAWTGRGLGLIATQLATVSGTGQSTIMLNAAKIEALDTAGAWILQQSMARWHVSGINVQVCDLAPQFAHLFAAVGEHLASAATSSRPPLPAHQSLLESLGRRTTAFFQQSLAIFSFLGECSMALASSLAHPARIRWRPILYNIRSAGFDALPIVGLLSFLLGVVVAYQGAAQLRQYGANIFVADLVGLSMLREFSPLMTAIIISGRSGSAYAAQIGTMAVTEEIDAMRTLGIAPLELLVLPKIMALILVLPLLTVFADVLGVFGGMIMARAQLDVGFSEFIERFIKAVSVTAYLTGLGKAPVFAVIIAIVGCFQGFQTKGGADSVGRQTTRSVVQATFIVIVADALFSVAFSALDL
jgi:phospholipid/cholesterol/gamma-HCH transport system permease protein